MSRIFAFILCLAPLSIASVFQAQSPRNPRMPPGMVNMPVDQDADTIRAARRVFLVNNGVDQAFTFKSGKPQQALYNEFYAALASWGHFQPVDSSDKADLIFSIGGTDPNHVSGLYHSPDDNCPAPAGTIPGRTPDCSTTHDQSHYDGQIVLRVLAPSDFQELWQTTIYLDRERIRLEQGVDELTFRLAYILNEPAPNPPDYKKIQPAPIPALLRTAKTVVVYDSSKDNPDLEPRAIAPLRSALTNWGRYTVADTPSAARVVLEVDRVADQSTFSGPYDSRVKPDAKVSYDLEAVDSATGLILWAVSTGAPEPGIWHPPAIDKTVATLVQKFRESATF